MSRTFLALLCLVLAATCARAPAATDRTLVIYSTTDLESFQPVIEDFALLRPDIEVRYVPLDAGPLYERFLREIERDAPSADLLLSSAMDLQVKLVNDGYAATHRSANVRALPAWARWRNQAFGFTFEPVVMVYNRRLLAGRAPPRSRSELLNALRQDADFWSGRIGTYDIEQSNAGYLLATQDTRQSDAFAALVEAMGDARVQTMENTSTLLDALGQGRLVLGYNLLGSYAQRRIDAGANLAIIHPEDYTLAVSRTAVIPASASHPDAAHAFLEYLLSVRGQQVLATRSRLNAVRSEVDGPYAEQAALDAGVGAIRPIALGPGLLVYLDRQKRQRFLDNWRASVRAPTRP